MCPKLQVFELFHNSTDRNILAAESNIKMGDTKVEIGVCLIFLSKKIINEQKSKFPEIKFPVQVLKHFFINH